MTFRLCWRAVHQRILIHTSVKLVTALTQYSVTMFINFNPHEREARDVVQKKDRVESK